MSRETFVWTPDRGVIPKSEAPQIAPVRGHSVISDFAEPVWNPADGKMYGSKGAYRRALRAAGCVEVGNENISSVERNRPRLDTPHAELARAIERGAR